jgi:drug/metabolite transporter (DMT)-like permease
MILSALSFALMGVFVKAAGDISVFQKSMIRSIAIMIFSFFMLRKSNLKLSGIKHHKLLLLRSLLGTVGIVLNYTALDNLILSDASVIFRLSTIFLIIFCWIFLGEKINLNQFISIILAFLGVVLIIKPAFSVRIIPYLIAVSGATMAALAYTVLRVLGAKEHPSITVFYFATFNTIALIPFVIFTFDKMTLMQFIYAFLAGIGATGGQIGISYAYKYAPAKEVSIFGYSGVVFSALFSVFLFGAVPDKISIIGYIIVFASSFYSYAINKKKSNKISPDKA